MIVTDWEKILHSNSQFPNITGLDESVVISDEFNKYINPDSNWENIRETGHTVIEFYNLNGQQIFLDITCIQSNSSWILTFSQLPTIHSKKSENNYDNLVESHSGFFQLLPVGIYRTTVNGKILRANNMLVKMLGYNSSEELKKECNASDCYVDRSLREKQLTKWKNTKQFGKQFEFQLKRKDGSIIWVRDQGQIALDENGVMASINGILTDVTAEHEVRELLWSIKNNLEEKVDEKDKRLTSAVRQQRITFKHLKTILDSIPDIAWLKDKDSRLIVANQAYADVARLPSAEDAIGKTDFEIWPYEVAMAYRQDDLEVIETRKKIITEEPSIDSEGNRFWYETIKLPVLNDQDEIIGTAGIARNITTRKGQQEKLEILIAERTHDLERTNEKLVQEIEEHKHLEKELEESSNRFKKLLDLYPGIVLIISRDGEVIDAQMGKGHRFTIDQSSIIGGNIIDVPLDTGTKNILGLEKIRKTIDTDKKQAMEFNFKFGEIERSYYAEAVKRDDLSVAVFVRDITDRKYNQFKLKQTNTFLDTIISTLHETIFVKDLEGRYTFYRWPKYEEQGLIQTEQFIGKRVEDFVTDENRIKLANRMFNRAIETGEPISYTTNQKFHQMNISEIMHITLSPMRDEKGNITSVVGVARSMTEKLKVEERVRLSEERYRTLSDGIDSPIFVHNGKNFLYFNNAFATTLGYFREELEEMDIYTILQTSQIDHMKNQFCKRQSGESVPSKAIIRVLTKSGEELIWEILISKTTFDLQDCSLISATDITNLKETQNKLESSNEFLNSVVTSMYEVVWAKDIEGRYTYYRWPEREKIGFTTKWHIGKKVEDCVTEIDHINITNSMFDKVIETGQSVSYQTEIFVEDLDRTELLQITLSPLKDSEGKITGIVGIGKSITKQYLAEEKAEYFEKRYTGIIEATDDIIFELRKNKVVFVSPSVERILGIAPEQLIGIELSELGREWKATFPSIESIQGKIFEFEMIDRNNKTRYFDIRINRSENSIFGVARETTRKKRLEQAREKYHSSLMHELKNPLVLIQGYAEMLESQLTSNASEMMKIIIESVKREDRRLTELDTKSASQRTYNFTQVPADGMVDRIEE
ncbi:MAG: PAS domain S-box protein, partial [Caldisericia bacterium]|nr:PAS domain S-box protein [Caldisericia bacterium]